jgi:hypothetical protein
VPESFSNERPPFTFTHNDLSAIAIADDDTACRFPNSNRTDCIYRFRPQLAQYAVQPDAPKTIEEYVKRGSPQLGLRITSYKDATLLGLTWPHTVMDGVGKKELMSAWSLMLAGQERDIPKMLGARDDVAWDIAGQYSDGEVDKSAVEDMLLKGMSRYKFISRFIWHTVTSPKADMRVFYLPKDLVTQWRQEAIDILPADPETGEHSFLSDGDIINAWIVKTVATTESKPSSYVLAGALNARYRVRQLQQAKGTHIQNLLNLYYARFPQDLAASTIAEIALAHRRQVAEQSTEHQLIRYFMTKRKQVESHKKHDKGVLCGHQNDLLIMCNNLSKIGIAAAADFSPAVLPREDGSRSTGTAAYYHFQSYGQMPRNTFIILNKDDSGYWIRATVSQRTWDRIMQDIGVDELE